MRNETPDRLMHHLADIGNRYPSAWKRYEDFRSDRGVHLPDWPNWCYCPIAGAYAIISGGGNNRVPPDRIHDCGILSALAAWRVGKGIYRIHPDLIGALLETPVGKIPIEILYRLPEWCIYIEAPDNKMHGFFVFLEHDDKEGHDELRLVIDGHDGLHQRQIHLDHENLDECVRSSVDYTLRAMEDTEADNCLIDTIETQQREIVREISVEVAPLLSLVLYVCSVAGEERDIRDIKGSDRFPAIPAPKKVKGGERIFTAGMPTVWETGYRMGAALGAAKGRMESADHGGTHSGPAPHVRRAHWHHYWKGPRKSQQELVLKWLHPILVGGDAEAVPVVHEVG